MDEGRRDHGAQQNRIRFLWRRESGRRRRTYEAGATKLFCVFRENVKVSVERFDIPRSTYFPPNKQDESKTSIPVADLFIKITECRFSLHGTVANDFASPPASSPLHGLPTHSTQVGRLSSRWTCSFPQERH